MKIPSRSGNKAGFSLIELVVVMTIMTMLAGVVVPVASTAIDREAEKQTRAEMRGLETAVREYFLDTQALPTNATALMLDDLRAGWSGPYITGGIQSAGATGTDFDEDGWGVPYTLSVVGDAWTLTSGGPDRTVGGTDDIVLTVDVTTARRDLTADRLEVINLAIRLYNEDWLSPPLPTIADPLDASWPTAFSQLVTRGYLPNATAYQTDAWGSDYVPEGGAIPVVGVTSPNMGS